MNDKPIGTHAGKPRRPPQFFDVPAGTAARKCDGCSAVIYMVPTARSRMPVRCDVEGGRPPNNREAGRGLSHFADCPGANDFRRRGRA